MYLAGAALLHGGADLPAGDEREQRADEVKTQNTARTLTRVSDTQAHKDTHTQFHKPANPTRCNTYTRHTHTPHATDMSAP